MSTPAEKFDGPAGAPDAAVGASLLTEMRGGGGAGGPDGVISAPPRRISAQLFVIVLVLVVSAAALYLMRRQGMGAGMTFQQVKIDQELGELARPADPKHTRILADLALSGAPPAVFTEDLDKNPFVLDAAPSAEDVMPLADPDDEARRLAELTKRNREQRDLAIAQALEGIQLHGVMAGRVPLARVNGETVQVGDRIGEYFTVAAIHGRSIDLEADGRVYAVEMSDGSPRPHSLDPRGGGDRNPRIR
jgi:hypothetical protein